MIVENIHNLVFKAGVEIQKIHCPWCHSERKNKTDKSLSINTVTRLYKCHHCEKAGKLDGYRSDENQYVRPAKTGWSKLGDEAAVFLKSRGFSLDTIQKNKIIQKQIGSDIFVGYPYILPNEANPVNVKWRCVSGKSFMQEKNAERVLYNIPLWQFEKELIIVEGENDVIACNEAGIWNVTTLSDGAINENDKSVDGKLKSLHNSFEYVKGMTSIVIATDNDPQGRRLRDELIKVFGAEKCKTVDWGEHKDANEVLLGLGKEGVLKAIADAKEVPVSGIFTLASRQTEMLDQFRNGVKMGDKMHMGNEMDAHFAWKKGQSNLWIGYMNMGKSTFLLQCCVVKSIMDGWKWAVFCPENYPADDFYHDLIEMYVGKHVSDRYNRKMNEDEYIEACQFINDHIFFIYPEENHTIETLHQKFEYLILKYGINGVIVDPYNQVEKTFSGDRADQEVGGFMRDVNRFAIKHDICYNIVLHPKNLTLKNISEFKAADFNDIALGANWGNAAFNIISYHRPNWFTERSDPSVEIHIQKLKRKRTGGNWGVVCFKWDFMLSRYSCQQGGQTVYPCDPSRKELKELNETWDEEYKESAVKPNELFTSSQDIKEQREDGLSETDDIYKEIDENRRR